MDLDTLDWREGGRPPQDSLSDMGYASNGQTLFLAGGARGLLVNYYDGILEWDPDNEVWLEREETLSQERGFLGAVFLTDDKVDCN